MITIREVILNHYAVDAETVQTNQRHGFPLAGYTSSAFAVCNNDPFVSTRLTEKLSDLM